MDVKSGDDGYDCEPLKNAFASFDAKNLLAQVNDTAMSNHFPVPPNAPYLLEWSMEKYVTMVVA